MDAKNVKQLDWRTVGMLAAMFVVAGIFWDTIFIYPIKLFVVVLHEFSHGIAAILTGGSIVRIEIDYRIGGLCYTQGGSTFFVASAGYLGSIVWGGIILMIAVRTRRDKLLGMVIGGLLALLALVYIRNPFGFFFTVGFGLALGAISFFARDAVVDLLLKFLGMTSCLYVIIDIKEDLIQRSGVGSDADAIAKLLGAPALSVPIGIFWILLALGAFAFFLWFAGKGEQPGGKTI